MESTDCSACAKHEPMVQAKPRAEKATSVVVAIETPRISSSSETTWRALERSCRKTAESSVAKSGCSVFTACANESELYTSETR